MDEPQSVENQKWLNNMKSWPLKVRTNELVNAARNGDAWRVQKLLDHGANKSYRGEAALRLAVENDQLDAVKLLIDDVKLQYALETDVFRNSINSKSYQVAQYFLTKSDPLRKQGDFETQILCTLAERGELSLLSQLLEKGFKLKLKKNTHIFNAAAKKGQKQVLNFLLDQGYDIQTENGVALTFPVYNQEYETIEFLLQKGLSANCHDNFAIDTACSWEDLKLLQLLVHYGADLKHDNYQCLHRAISNGRMDAVSMLMDFGCDTILRSPDIRKQVNNIKSPIITNVNQVIDQWFNDCITPDALKKSLNKDDLFSTTAQNKDCLFAKAIKSNLLGDTLKHIAVKNIKISIKDLCQTDKNGTPLIDLIIGRNQLDTLFTPQFWKNNSQEMKNIWHQLITPAVQQKVPFESYYNKANIISIENTSLNLKRRPR